MASAPPACGCAATAAAALEAAAAAAAAAAAVHSTEVLLGRCPVTRRAVRRVLTARHCGGAALSL
jgi:hypothetical protein